MKRNHPLLIAFFYLVGFLILNFSGLAIGAWAMADGPQSDWYLALNKAPWTPPGWVFGAAWSLIMLCFSIYLTRLIMLPASNRWVLLFAISWGLNVIWNFIFFSQHWVILALAVIVALFFCIGVFFIYAPRPALTHWRYLLLPYLIWLAIAISLNAYIAGFN
ncbi:TspO/MBR family protein [Ostreibacterium oceani]|uniref:Tryptophan-rich sensory protein n=1 Tax=Ostreibacterium oceani TaxID=2654998 RepID=A0A6N7EXL7_9GAMM|nr:TspO/MBR family protein [Ostreibacterium oceani]MPV86335.1 tryptophan-rich sensory protein [Ostreibacterium oceani]